MNHTTEGYGRCRCVSEREAEKIKAYNKSYIQKESARKLALRKKIEKIQGDRRRAKELGLTLEQYKRGVN